MSKKLPPLRSKEDLYTQEILSDEEECTDVFTNQRSARTRAPPKSAQPLWLASMQDAQQRLQLLE